MKGTEYLLLQHRTNIDTADVGSALESAAEGGDIAIVYDNVFDEEDRKRGRKLRSDDSDSPNPKKGRH
jgi:hypothetical protein